MPPHNSEDFIMINEPTAKETNCMETKKAFLAIPAGKLWKAKKEFVKNLEQARMMRALKYWKLRQKRRQKENFCFD